MGTPAASCVSTTEAIAMVRIYGSSPVEEIESTSQRLTPSGKGQRPIQTYDVYASSLLLSPASGSDRGNIPLSSASFHNDNLPSVSQLSPLAEFPSCSLETAWIDQINQVNREGETVIFEMRGTKYVCFYCQQKQVNEQTLTFRLLVPFKQAAGDKTRSQTNELQKLLNKVTFAADVGDPSHFAVNVNLNQLDDNQKSEVNHFLTQSPRVLLVERERLYQANLTEDQGGISYELDKMQFRFNFLDSKKMTDFLMEKSQFDQMLPLVIRNSDQKTYVDIRSLLSPITAELTQSIKRSLLEELAKQKNDDFETRSLTKKTIKELKQKNKVLTERLDIAELKINLLDIRSDNGTIIWLIPGIEEKIKREKNQEVTSLYSPPFYTSKFGFRMCLQLFLNGDADGRNTHVTLYFVIMKGEYDGIQTWPFKQKVNLYWLNQEHPGDKNAHITRFFIPREDSRSFKRPADLFNHGYGYTKFASIAALKNPEFVKDDTMYIKAKVDPDGL